MSTASATLSKSLLYIESVKTDCPYCHYSNHYPSFFKMLPFKRDLIKRVFNEQHDPALAAHTGLNSPFDQLFLRYIQAIHINEAVNSNDSLLIGKLWLKYLLALRGRR